MLGFPYGVSRAASTLYSIEEYILINPLTTLRQSPLLIFRYV